VSVTALDERTFLVLGERPACVSRCTRLARSDDGGQTFTALTPPDEGRDKPSAGAGSLRFGSSQDGWMVGADLWSTHDGAQTWSQADLPGQVQQLEAAAGTVWAVVSRGEGADATLWRSPVSSDDWSQVQLPRQLQGPVDLAVQGRRVVVLGAAAGNALLVSEDGSSFEARPSPCTSGLGGRLSSADRAVWFVCANGTSATVFISVGTDSGFETVPTGFLPDALPGQTELGARDTEAAVLGVPGDGGLVGVSSSGERLSSSPGGTGWSFVGFTTPDVGYALTCCSVRQLLRTTDGGANWAEVRVAP
jgi:photosystem II stability/assembly factor-like uncharacterized protein